MKTTLKFNLTHALDAQDLAAKNTQSEILDFIAELVDWLEDSSFRAAVIERLGRGDG